METYLSLPKEQVGTERNLFRSRVSSLKQFFLFTQGHCSQYIQVNVAVATPSAWPDSSKFCQFSEILNSFGEFLMVYLVFGKLLNQLWEVLYDLGQILFVVNDQILQNRCLTVWSHWTTSATPLGLSWVSIFLTVRVTRAKTNECSVTKLGDIYLLGK